MKNILAIFIILILASCAKDDSNPEKIINQIYQQDLQPLQGNWSYEGKYFHVSDKTVTLNLFDVYQCDTAGTPLPNYYLNDYLYNCGDTVIYHGNFYFLDHRGMILNLSERGYWSFQYQFQGNDSLWFNPDTIQGPYKNILFIRE